MQVFCVAKQLPREVVYLSGPGQWTYDPTKAMLTGDRDLAERDCGDWISYYSTKGFGGSQFFVAEFSMAELEALD